MLILMIWKILKWSFIAVVTIFILGVLGNSNKNAATQTAQTPATGTTPTKSVVVTAKSRPFYMGFTPWPPDATVDAVNSVYDFIGKHADLISHHLDNGIPWDEALNGTELPKNLLDNWNWRKSKTPTGAKVFVSITPLDFSRANIAPYWSNAGDNQPLPDSWKNKRLNDPDVKKAYLAYAKQAADYFHPQYMAIGIEANMLAIKNPGMWQDFLELNAYVYSELKKAYPNMLVFDTIQYEWLKGIEPESKGKSSEQVAAVKEMLKSSDAIALSTYHYGVYHNPVTADYFAFARSLDANKPMIISEAGILSMDTQVAGTLLKANEDDQKQFLAMLLKGATDEHMLFFNYFLAIDYDKLLSKLPTSVQEVARAWAHVGMEDQNYTPKPALSLWDEYLKLPYSR